MTTTTTSPKPTFYLRCPFPWADTFIAAIRDLATIAGYDSNALDVRTHRIEHVSEKYEEARIHYTLTIFNIHSLNQVCVMFKDVDELNKVYSSVKLTLLRRTATHELTLISLPYRIIRVLHGHRNGDNKTPTICNDTIESCGEFVDKYEIIHHLFGVRRPRYIFQLTVPLYKDNKSELYWGVVKGVNYKDPAVYYDGSARSIEVTFIYPTLNDGTQTATRTFMTLAEHQIDVNDVLIISESGFKKYVPKATHDASCRSMNKRQVVGMQNLIRLEYSYLIDRLTSK